MISRFLLLFSALLILSYSEAQHTIDINYTVEDGLPSNMVYCIEQDERGFMWFGTDSGLSRFDGYEFVNYSLSDGLPDTEILNFYEDSKSRIWFYTFNGKVGFLKHDSIYNSSNTPWLRNLDFTGRITSIVEHNGLLYFTAISSVIKVLNEEDIFTIDPGLEPLETFSICACDNELKAVSIRRVLTLKKGKISRSTYIKDISSPIYPFCYKNKIYTFSRNSKDHGIVIIDEKEVKAKRMLFENRILNLKRKNDQLLVFRKSGIFKLNLTNPSQIRPWRPLLWPSSIFKDIENNNWYSSLKNGVSLSADIEVYREGTIGNATALHYSDSSLYIGHDGSTISRYNKNSNELEKRINLSYVDNINAIVVDSNRQIWTLRSGQILRDDRSFSIKGGRTFDSHGDFLFVGRPRTLAIHNLVSNTLQEVLQGDILDMLVIHEDSVLMGTGEGLLLYTKDEIKEPFNHPLLKTRIHRMAFDKEGNLWMVTGGNGLLKMAKNGDITQISTADGLSSNVCINLAIKDSNVWVVTTKGLNKVLLDSSGYSLSTMDKSNGLSSYQINDITWFNDSIYLAKDDGLYSFSDKIELHETNRLKIYIDRVLTNGHLAVNNLFEHTVSSIQVTFKVLAFRHHNSLRYQYQIQEFDTSPAKSEWLDTYSNIVTFSSLNPSSYVLWIRAKTKNSTWTDPFPYSFEVSPAFWQTSLFQIVTLLLTLFCILIGTRFFYKNRENKKDLSRAKLSAEIKALKAQINPHFLFNGLNSIQAFILDGDLENSEQYLSKYGKLMRRILTSSEKMIATIEDELETIKLYTDLEKIRIENDFDLTVKVQDSINIKTQKIPSMIIQPFIENAIWHGITPLRERGKIELQIEDRNEDLEITITDNGVGFDPDQAQSKNSHKSFGTKLVAERLELINALNNNTSKFQITSQPGNGTKVVMLFPRSLN